MMDMFGDGTVSLRETLVGVCSVWTDGERGAAPRSSLTGTSGVRAQN